MHATAASDHLRARNSRCSEPVAASDPRFLGSLTAVSHNNVLAGGVQQGHRGGSVDLLQAPGTAERPPPPAPATPTSPTPTTLGKTPPPLPPPGSPWKEIKWIYSMCVAAVMIVRVLLRCLRQGDVSVLREIQVCTARPSTIAPVEGLCHRTQSLGSQRPCGKGSSMPLPSRTCRCTSPSPCRSPTSTSPAQVALSAASHSPASLFPAFMHTAGDSEYPARLTSSQLSALPSPAVVPGRLPAPSHERGRPQSGRRDLVCEQVGVRG